MIEIANMTLTFHHVISDQVNINLTHCLVLYPPLFQVLKFLGTKVRSGRYVSFLKGNEWTGMIQYAVTLTFSETHEKPWTWY